MDFDGPVIHGLEYQARSLAAVKGDSDYSRFLVGTLALRTKNKIHCIDFDDDNNIIATCGYLHSEGEIWDISTSYQNPDLFATRFSNPLLGKSVMRASVWSLKGDREGLDGGGSSELVHILDLSKPNGDGEEEAEKEVEIRKVLWCPEPTTGPSIVALSDTSMRLWDLEKGCVSAKVGILVWILC